MLKTRVPDKLFGLIDKFKANESYYKSGKFYETETRIEFIDPLMRLLGWDIENAAGYSPDYKDVYHEARTPENKRMDYVFKAGGKPKFLLEAKNPSINIEQSGKAIDQAKSYATTNKIPVAILTDFEEFAIYLCHSEDESENFSFGDAKKHLVFYCNYYDYPRYWNFLHTFLSKKAIMYGIHDQIVRRLMQTKRQLHKSIYIFESFNLLYSIAESFGSENLIVEQDQAIETLSLQSASSTLSNAPEQSPFANSVGVTVQSTAGSNFSLTPVFR